MQERIMFLFCLELNAVLPTGVGGPKVPFLHTPAYNILQGASAMTDKRYVSVVEQLNPDVLSWVTYLPTFQPRQE